ncbi:hypothetical protein HU200_052926 [Digitaria exilis]|uniref:F-box domain-containing protein n=1 Tax=Digitaria exilis TaxID=1010633 RepID=A0A835AS87_9POAL|nr:hypothetical protein HU200_052926 [Digitaria exilis]
MAPLPARRRRRTPASNPTAPRKRRRASTSTPASIAPVLPTNVMLEIVARSDTRTLVRCAALCKPLRRTILSPAFLRRAAAIVPPRLLGYLHTFDMDKEDEELPDALFSLLHPDPTTAGSFSDEHLPRFVGRSAADLLGSYKPLTSRNGLAVLLRRHVNRRRWSQRRSDVCVYNPVTGERTFFSYPPDYWRNYFRDLGPVFVLLTAGDGIGCDFKLLAVDFYGFFDSSASMHVQTMSSSSSEDGAWSPVEYVHGITCESDWMEMELSRDAAVLHGRRIHWLAKRGEVILTYDVATSETGAIWVPVDYEDVSKLHLGISPDGRLRLLVVEGFRVSVWLRSAGRGGWELKAVIDTEAKLRSLCPEIMAPDGPTFLEFIDSGEKSGVALLRIKRPGCRVSCRRWLIVLEVETGEVRKIWCPHRSNLVVEIDMPSRLQTMKVFS